jgi:hypothetical protein
MPAVAIFHGKTFLGAVQGLQTWDDYCQKLVAIMQKPQSTPRVIAVLAENEQNA